jgi:hypothetical protein
MGIREQDLKKGTWEKGKWGKVNKNGVCLRFKLFTEAAMAISCFPISLRAHFPYFREIHSKQEAFSRDSYRQTQPAWVISSPKPAKLPTNFGLSM